VIFDRCFVNMAQSIAKAMVKTYEQRDAKITRALKERRRGTKMNTNLRRQKHLPVDKHRLHAFSLYLYVHFRTKSHVLIDDTP
jgi:hypothetical protein